MNQFEMRLTFVQKTKLVYKSRNIDIIGVIIKNGGFIPVNFKDNFMGLPKTGFL